MHLAFKVLVWPWKLGQGYQNLITFPLCQWCFCASLVKIYTHWFRRQSADKAHFTDFIVWLPWKLGEGHQNLIKSLTIPTMQNIKFGQNPSFGSRDRLQTGIFWSTFDIQSELKNKAKVTKI